MVRYEVLGADASARLTTLVVEAVDADDARQQAARMQLQPVSVRRRGREGPRRSIDLALFAEELQMLLDAGLPLIDAVEGLAARRTDAASAPVHAALAAALRHGERLSSALARQPEVFPPLLVGIVRAAERTSSLPESLARYVVYEGHLRALRERLTSAAIYPVILLAVGGAVTLFLMGYVVPRFALVYESGGRDLPFVSRALLQGGRWVAEYWPYVVVAVALTAHALRLRVRRQPLGGLGLLTLAPGGRTRLETIEVSRLYRTLGMLLQGGLTVREALGLADAVVSPRRRDALARARRDVEGGEPLSVALHRAELSAPLALRLVQVGERSGQLGAMLERASRFLDHEAALWLERFGRWLGPVLMILISVVVGVIVVFLYIPVFDLVGTLR